MTHATVSARAAKRVFNFNAGPGALPLPVLERIREELLDWRGSGMSVMEMSHRSPEFESINAAANQKLRSLLGISDDYAVIFLQGGGSMQFTMAPMNLCLPGKPVDVLHTGAWTAKAISELKKGILHNIAASTESEKFSRIPRKGEIKFSPDASYVHICTNNTIEGTQWTTLPETGNVALVADMSSDIASRPVDVKKFGLIFAGAQKNLGPSGVTIVILRKDLAERAAKNLPTLLQYRTHIKENSLYHTPPTFAVYVVGLVLEWIESEGGVQGMRPATAPSVGCASRSTMPLNPPPSRPLRALCVSSSALAADSNVRFAPLLRPVPGGSPLVYSDIESARQALRGLRGFFKWTLHCPQRLREN